MKTLRVMLIILGALSFGPAAQAGRIKLVPPGKSDSPAGTLVIANRATQVVEFGLSLDRKAWEVFKLDSGDTREARVDDDQTEKFYIKLRTGSKDLLNTLRVGKRYQVYWNAGKKRWDVAELKEGK